MKQFLKLTVLEVKLNMRNFLTLFFALIFPVMMLLLFGSMYGNKPTEYMGGYGAVDFSVPGYICMIIAVTGLMTLPLTLAQYRERKILKRFMVTPISPFKILLSQLVVNAIITIIGIIILLIIGVVVFDLHFFGNIIIAILAFILILLSVFSIGLLIAGVSKNAKLATAIAYVIYFPMLFLSGATMPLKMFPAGVQNISKALPLSYGVELFQGIWLNKPNSNALLDIFVLLGMTILFIILSIKFFKWE